jgi:pimeloyl-ACP methyl ester carboxylesterase
MNIHTIQGAGNVNLHVREWGKRDGIPILLIHGWSQSHLCWKKQYESELCDESRIIAMDLRGHGMSDAPLQAEQYVDGDKWADDVEAIIRELALDKPILVGWSYGGFVIGDYLRRHGQKKIAGIHFVAGAVVLGPKAFGSLIGPGFLDHAPTACREDLPASIAAIRRFLRACCVKPIPQDDFELMLASNMVVHPKIRGFLIQRELDFGQVLQNIEIPVLVTQGRCDTVVLPAMSEFIADHCRTAEISWYEGVGHTSFLEEPRRFNQELIQFARNAHRDSLHRTYPASA